jgi:hypothetical protein
LDGRNRLEAMERAGLSTETVDTVFVKGDPVAAIISANVHRRHLTKLAQAEMIVAACKADETLRHEWRGVAADPVKAAAVASDASLTKPISKRTVERALAHEHPNEPGGRVDAEMKKAFAKAKKKKQRATLQEYSQQLARLPKNLDGARRFYLEFAAKPGVELGAERR